MVYIRLNIIIISAILLPVVVVVPSSSSSGSEPEVISVMNLKIYCLFFVFRNKNLCLFKKYLGNSFIYLQYSFFLCIYCKIVAKIFYWD